MLVILLISYYRPSIFPSHPSPKSLSRIAMALHSPQLQGFLGWRGPAWISWSNPARDKGRTGLGVWAKKPTKSVGPSGQPVLRAVSCSNSSYITPRLPGSPHLLRSRNESSEELYPTGNPVRLQLLVPILLFFGF